MAFPFAPWPHLEKVLADFSSRFGCTYSERIFKRGDGKEARVTIIERQVNGIRHEACVEASAGKPLGPSQLRSLCRRLQIRPSSYNSDLMDD